MKTPAQTKAATAQCGTRQPDAVHYVQKAASSHASCCAAMPVREVQLHENHISGPGIDYVARAWYVKTEDGVLHGQFHSEAEADAFARNTEAR